MNAAANLAATLSKLRSIFNDLPQDQLLSWSNQNGNNVRVMSVAEIQAEINNTKFVISDQPNYNNGGFGTAARGYANNPNQDVIWYEPFDGDRDLTNPNDPSSGNDYADPNYLNGEGMMAIVLHEFGHMTYDGFQFDSSSKRSYLEEHGNYNNYGPGDEYWNNNENFANSYAQIVGNSIGMDLSGVFSGFNTSTSYGDPLTWVEPGQILADHTHMRPFSAMEGSYYVEMV